MKSLSQIKTAFTAFLFTPSYATPLGVLRISVTGVLLLQAFLLAPEFFNLYGAMGILQGNLAAYFARQDLIHAHQIAERLISLGISQDTTLITLASFYLLALLALLVGWRTRIAAIAVWALHTIMVASHNTGYGLDTYAHIFLFYLMIFPSGHALSLDRKLGRVTGAPSWQATFGLRVMQLHMGIAYLASAIEKGMGEQWWNGEAIWRSLSLPLYAQYDLSFLASVPWLPILIGWGTLALEGGYILFMFLPKTRPIFLALIVSLHVGIMIFLGLHLFGLIMALINISLFGVANRPQMQGAPSPSKRILSPLSPATS